MSAAARRRPAERNGGVDIFIAKPKNLELQMSCRRKHCGKPIARKPRAIAGSTEFPNVIDYNNFVICINASRVGSAIQEKLDVASMHHSCKMLSAESQLKSSQQMNQEILECA